MLNDESCTSVVTRKTCLGSKFWERMSGRLRVEQSISLADTSLLLEGQAVALGSQFIEIETRVRPGEECKSVVAIAVYVKQVDRPLCSF